MGGRDGLDEAEELLGVRHVGEAMLAVSSGHFQTVTICNGFISLVREAFFHDSPIDLRIGTFGEHGNDIDDGEIPFLLRLVPRAADVLFFKQDDVAHEYALFGLGFGEAVAAGK